MSLEFDHYACPACERLSFHWTGQQWECRRCGLVGHPSTKDLLAALQFADPLSQAEALTFVELLARGDADLEM